MRLLLVSILIAGGLFAADFKYDGARVHYESYGKGKDATVFIHGWTCDLTFWRGQSPFYQKQRSLLVDLPGHGLSEKPEVAYTEERFARAIEAAMRDAGVERAVLVGHSMGGTVALEFLRLFPGKTKAIVFVDAYVPLAPKDEAEQTAQKASVDPFIRSFLAPGYKETVSKMIDSMFSEKTTAAQREEIRSKMLSTPQHVMASAMEGMFALPPIKPGETYAVPAMAIMSATGNRNGLEENLRKTFPNLKYDAWQGSGHFLMLETPDRFNSALSEFVAGLK